VSWVCGIAASISLGAAISASASKPVAIEKDLLGIRVLQNYREVLLRYGAPTRIFRATETVSYREAVSLSGTSTGGILGIADGSGGGGGGGGMSGPGGGGMAQRSPGGGGSGSASAALPPGATAPTMGPGGGGSQAPPGYPGASGGGGGGSASGDNPDASYSESGGFIWVYLYQNKELAYEFHFNKDGRVERIAELGRGFGQHTSRGIGLGDTIDKIYTIYGWTDRIKEEDAGKFSLLYNDKFHAQFLILKNRVIGISVFLKENQYMNFNEGSGGANGAPGGGGPGGPGAMMPGMASPGGGGARAGGKRGGGAFAPPGG